MANAFHNLKGSKSKRQAKEEEKKAIKDSKNDSDHDFPVKINSLKMLSEERRKISLSSARQRYTTATAQTAEFDVKVYTYLIKRE
jgi:hypothetical protein